MLEARELAQLFDHARELGEGRWVARCPVHDRGQNLYITDGDSGKTLMYCQSGCSNVEILKKVGLTWRDLFSGDAPKRPYDSFDDHNTLLFYRQGLANGEKNMNPAFVKQAGIAQERLRKHGFILKKSGELQRVTRAN